MAVDVVTFGCRLNAFESEVIRREAEQAGLTDTIVINSCAVTNEAVAQARQSIRKLKRERPAARIVVTGCAAQTQADMFAEMAEVDRVVGNDELETYVKDYAATIAANAPLTVDSISFIVGEALKGESKRDMKRCEDLVTQCFRSADYEEGRKAFMEKRKPAFKGR